MTSVYCTAIVLDMKVYDFKCPACDCIFEEFVANSDEIPPCPFCYNPTTEKQANAHAGYRMASGGSSTRPKGAGSFKRVK